MKITIDTETNTVKLGRKLYDELEPMNKEIVAYELCNFVTKKIPMSDYEEDSMWMSYRYCIGRHTIAAHMRAGDIASHCYGRMSKERSIFTAFDINREIERCMQFGCGPVWHFPITSLNKIYTSAIDIFCQFVEDFNITSKEQLLEYKDVNVILCDNERGYKIETTTWEEYLRPKVHKIVTKFYYNTLLSENYCWNLFNNKNFEFPPELKAKFNEIQHDRQSPDSFYLSNIDDLMVWNHLVHLFDIEHHHKSILTNGEEVEWFWTYDHDTYQKEDDPDHYYQKEIGYKKIRMPINAKIGSMTTSIPDESIKKNIY